MNPKSLQGRLVLRLSLAMVAIIAVGFSCFIWHVYEEQQKESSQIAHEVIKEFMLDIAWGFPIAGIMTVVVAALVVRRGLAPLRELAARAEAISPGAPLPRLTDAAIPTELMPFVTAFDQAAARLDGALAAQKRFSANAAHELRTPLTVLSGRLDRFAERNVAPEDIHTLRADCARMARVVAQLTALARAEGIMMAPDARVVLPPLLREVASGLAPLAGSRNVTIGLDVATEQLAVRGAIDSIEPMLRNVIENAVLHAPAGTEVTIRLGEDASVEVEDAGPGIPASLRRQVFERFWRGSWSRHVGSGLGLAIASEAAARIGATMSLGDAPNGGTLVTMRFQPA